MPASVRHGPHQRTVGPSCGIGRNLALADATTPLRSAHGRDDVRERRRQRVQFDVTEAGLAEHALELAERVGVARAAVCWNARIVLKNRAGEGAVCSACGACCARGTWLIVGVMRNLWCRSDDREGRGSRGNRAGVHRPDRSRESPVQKACRRATRRAQGMNLRGFGRRRLWPGAGRAEKTPGRTTSGCRVGGFARGGRSRYA